MKASRILIRALLAVPLLLIEIEPGASDGSDDHNNCGVDERPLAQRHLATDSEGRTR